MDLLSQRYANPYMILDDMIRLRQLHEFSNKVFKDIADEKIHNTRWEYYLHKIYDISFEEFVRKCEQPQVEVQAMSHEEIGNVINDSKKMLEGFIPS